MLGPSVISLATSCQHCVVKTNLLLHIRWAHCCCCCRSLLFSPPFFFKLHPRDPLPCMHALLQCRLGCTRPFATHSSPFTLLLKIIINNTNNTQKTCLHPTGCAEEDTSSEGHISALHHPRHHEQHPVPRQVHTAAGAPRGGQDHPAECPLWSPAQEPQH